MKAVFVTFQPVLNLADKDVIEGVMVDSSTTLTELNDTLHRTWGISSEFQMKVHVPHNVAGEPAKGFGRLDIILKGAQQALIGDATHFLDELWCAWENPEDNGPARIKV